MRTESFYDSIIADSVSNIGHGLTEQSGGVLGRGGQSIVVSKAKATIEAHVRAGMQLDASEKNADTHFDLFVKWLGEPSDGMRRGKHGDAVISTAFRQRSSIDLMEYPSPNRAGQGGLSCGPIRIARQRRPNWEPVRASQKIRDMAISNNKLESLHEMEKLLNLYQYRNVNYERIFRYVSFGNYSPMRNLDRVNVVHGMVALNKSDYAIHKEFGISVDSANYVRKSIYYT